MIDYASINILFHNNLIYPWSNSFLLLRQRYPQVLSTRPRKVAFLVQYFTSQS